jgi:hypothetical protein
MEVSAMDSFVYIWHNIETNRKYIGVHKGTPDDGYICSSKTMLEDYKKNPSIFTRQVIAHGTFEDMYVLETKMLHEIDAAKNPQYYNQSNNNGKFYMSRMPESGKEKLRQKAIGRTAYNKGISNPNCSERMKKNNPMHDPMIAAKSLETRRKNHCWNKNGVRKTGHKPHNYVDKMRTFCCDTCGKENTVRNVKGGKTRRFCNRSCQATFTNKQRCEEGYSKKNTTYKHKDQRFLITNGTETKLHPKNDPVPHDWKLGRHWVPNR